MDPSRDNPFLRFATFWWALGTFLFFGLFIALIGFLGREAPTDLEDAAAAPRYVIKASVDTAQGVSLPAAELEAALSGVAAQLAASKPVAVELPEQIVPGSATAEGIAAAPAADTSAVDEAAPEPDAPIDPAVMELGQASFMICGACHGQNGEAGLAGPPLAGSEWVTGPISNLILIQLRGLQGAITVKGVEYNFPGGMAPMAYQTDEQIAAVLTYVRNSFGNRASAVAPAQVAALRSEVGKPQVTVEELIQP
ncbi:MAG: cytochrome c [Akkermansiaceae bacterium]